MRSKKTHEGSLAHVTSRDPTAIAVSTAGGGPPLVCVGRALCTRSQGGSSAGRAPALQPQP
jgi:hypothetical protein